MRIKKRVCNFKPVRYEMDLFGRHLKLLIISSITILTALSIFISCGKGSGIGDGSEYFSFDRSNLGIEIVDQEMGIKFYPPKEWELRQTSISRKIESRDSSNPADQFIYHPTYVFFNNSTGGLLSVGRVTADDTTLTGSARINFYKGLLNTKHKNDNLSTANFVHSKLYFSRFKIQKQNLVSYKLIFENKRGEIIEFDYTIPQDNLESADPSIKSSIGSIRPE